MKSKRMLLNETSTILAEMITNDGFSQISESAAICFACNSMDLAMEGVDYKTPFDFLLITGLDSDDREVTVLDENDYNDMLKVYEAKDYDFEIPEFDSSMDNYFEYLGKELLGGNGNCIDKKCHSEDGSGYSLNSDERIDQSLDIATKL